MIAKRWATGPLSWRWSRTTRQVHRSIRELRLPPAPQLTHVIDRVSLRRGRQVSLVPSHLRHLGLSGVWLDIGDRDLIAYETAASSWTQRYIICHEIGHMILDHPQLNISQLARRHNMNGDLAVCGLAYSDVMEAEAEAIARLLVRQLTYVSAVGEHGTDLQTVAGRIAITLQRSA